MKTVCLFGCLLVRWFTAEAQSVTTTQLTGTWIGLRIEYDEHIDRPFPVSMMLGSDSSYALQLLDENSPARHATWSLNEPTVRLDTNTYALDQWSLQNGELRLMGAFPVAFRRLTDIAIEPAAAKQTLTGYSWIADSVSYHFHANGSACVLNQKTGDLTAHCWRIAPVGHAVFLVLKGNMNECSGNFQYPLQVTKLTNNQIECLGGSSRGGTRVILHRDTALVSNAACPPKGFQPCYPNAFWFSNVRPLYPYFTYRRGRLHDIRTVVEHEFKPIPLPGQSGLIRFRFMVNCRGEAGQFEVLEVDDKYQKCRFDPRITRQLLHICRDKLTDWEPGVPTGGSDQEPVDTVCLLTFRLKDGLITDIFP